MIFDLFHFKTERIVSWFFFLLLIFDTTNRESVHSYVGVNVGTEVMECQKARIGAVSLTAPIIAIATETAQTIGVGAFGPKGQFKRRRKSAGRSVGRP
jgi:hypothetical protein